MESHKIIYWVVMFIASIAPYATGVTITNVQISPQQPSIIDSITVKSQGGFPGGALFYDTSVFTIDGLSLQLDLYFTSGYGPQIPQMWWHDNEIGILSAGNYDLLVQAYWRSSETSNYVWHDDYLTNFEVVIPEPATLSILGLGFLFIHRKQQSTRQN